MSYLKASYCGLVLQVWDGTSAQVKEKGVNLNLGFTATLTISLFNKWSAEELESFGPAFQCINSNASEYDTFFFFY